LNENKRKEVDEESCQGNNVQPPDSESLLGG